MNLIAGVCEDETKHAANKNDLFSTAFRSLCRCGADGWNPHLAMTDMTLNMRQFLPDLREIGFAVWDPLSLREALAEGAPISDEYDQYLLVAFSAAYRGETPAEIANILYQGEIDMGFDDTPIGAASRDQAASQINSYAAKIMAKRERPNNG